MTKAEPPCTWLANTPCINQSDCLGCKIPNTRGCYWTGKGWEYRWMPAKDRERIVKRHTAKIRECLAEIEWLGTLPTEPPKEEA